MAGIQRYIRGRESYALALLLFAVASCAGVILFSYDRHVFLYFGDAASHIVKARRLIDSQLPMESIGTIWLPLQHLLLVPFVFFDSLFYSGIAGPALGIPCFVGTGVLLFMIVRRITGLSSISFVSACLFGLNPNIIYMALTPMNELTFLFLATLGGYAFLRWREAERVGWLALCAIAVMLASLCRYEAWILAAFVFCISSYRGLTDWKQKGRREGLRMLAIAVLCVSGILIWLWWNAFEFGNAFQFAPLRYRPGPADAGTLMSYRQESVSITLARAVLNVFGPMSLLASAIGLVRLTRVSSERRHIPLLVFFSLPALFVFAGILTDTVLIDQWWWNWRFVLPLGLFLCVSGGLGLSEYFSRASSRLARSGAIAALFIMPVVQLIVPSVSVATYEDATKIFHGPSKDAAAFGEKLGKVHNGGTVVLLAGSGLGERIMVSSGLPLKFFHIIRFPGGVDIQGSLQFGDRYVVLGKTRWPDSREAVDYWLSRRETFLRYYQIILEDEHYILLERKSSD